MNFKQSLQGPADCEEPKVFAEAREKSLGIGRVVTSSSV